MRRGQAEGKRKEGKAFEIDKNCERYGKKEMKKMEEEKVESRKKEEK